MDILFSDEFKNEFKKIKEQAIRERIMKQIKKLATNPTVGKPLQHHLKHHRSLRVPPFRIIYRIDNDTIIVNTYQHRKGAYKQ